MRHLRRPKYLPACKRAQGFGCRVHVPTGFSFVASPQGFNRNDRRSAPLREQIGVWQHRVLSDNAARLMIYAAFLDRGLPLPKHLMGVVHKHYFQLEYAAFKDRTLWSLSNAFTSAFKVLNLVSQFQATAKLGGFLARHELGGSVLGEMLPAGQLPEALAVSA